MVLEKVFESPLDCREMKLVNLKRNQPWISIERTESEAPVLWPPDTKSQLTGKTLILGKIESKRRKEQQRMRWFDGITDSMDMSWSKLRETVKDRKAWCATVQGITKSWTQLSKWTTAQHTYRFTKLPPQWRYRIGPFPLKTPLYYCFQVKPSTHF